jgi:hypothetical protein
MALKFHNTAHIHKLFNCAKVANYTRLAIGSLQQDNQKSENNYTPSRSDVSIGFPPRIVSRNDLNKISLKQEIEELKVCLSDLRSMELVGPDNQMQEMEDDEQQKDIGSQNNISKMSYEIAPIKNDSVYYESVIKDLRYDLVSKKNAALESEVCEIRSENSKLRLQTQELLRENKESKHHIDVISQRAEDLREKQSIIQQELAERKVMEFASEKVKRIY